MTDWGSTKRDVPDGVVEGVGLGVPDGDAPGEREGVGEVLPLGVPTGLPLGVPLGDTGTEGLPVDERVELRVRVWLAYARCRAPLAARDPPMGLLPLLPLTLLLLLLPLLSSAAAASGRAASDTAASEGPPSAMAAIHGRPSQLLPLHTRDHAAGEGSRLGCSRHTCSSPRRREALASTPRLTVGASPLRNP